MQNVNARATLTVRHDVALYQEQDGSWVYRKGSDEVIGNILTNAGRVTLHTFIYGTPAQRAAALLGASGLNYIGITDDAAAPNAADTSLAAELSSNGLARVQGSVALPTGSGAVTTVQYMFTYTGIPAQSVRKTALFDAPTGGNMCHEVLFSPKTLQTNDTLTVIMNITLT